MAYVVSMLQSDGYWLVFRPAFPALRLPLGVRSVGRYTVPAGWSDPVQRKWFLQLYWGVSGEGEFRVGRRRIVLRPGELTLYHPGETHRIRALSSEWSYCWITFDHPEILRWIEGFGLVERTRRAGVCPEELFERIGHALHAGTIDGEREAANLAHEILSLVAAGVTPVRDDSVAARARAWMERRFCDPMIGVDTVADAVGVHRSTLFRNFVSAYGLKPSAHLHNLRVRHALAALRNSEKPIHVIARESGFSDANYFARAIRSATGQRPTELREKV